MKWLRFNLTVGINLSNDTYYLTPKCQIMNQETKLIKTKLGLLNLAEHLNYVTPLLSGGVPRIKDRE